jgi:hypothetical protein
MAYYKDVREYLQALENNDKLVRIKQPINKDTELHPLVRLQYRGLAEADRNSPEPRLTWEEFSITLSPFVPLKLLPRNVSLVVWTMLHPR